MILLASLRSIIPQRKYRMQSNLLFLTPKTRLCELQLYFDSSRKYRSVYQRCQRWSKCCSNILTKERKFRLQEALYPPTLAIPWSLLWCTMGVSLCFLVVTSSWAWRRVTKIPLWSNYVADSSQGETSMFNVSKIIKDILMGKWISK